MERDPLAGHTYPLNKLSPGATECGSCKILKGKALQPLLCPPDTNVLPYAPTILPSSPAELWLWKAKILIKTAQKAENAWNKVTVTVKCPEMPIRNCNTGVLLQLTPP